MQIGYNTPSLVPLNKYKIETLNPSDLAQQRILQLEEEKLQKQLVIQQQRLNQLDFNQNQVILRANQRIYSEPDEQRRLYASPYDTPADQERMIMSIRA